MTVGIERFVNSQCHPNQKIEWPVGTDGSAQKQGRRGERGWWGYTGNFSFKSNFFIFLCKHNFPILIFEPGHVWQLSVPGSRCDNFEHAKFGCVSSHPEAGSIPAVHQSLGKDIIH